MPDRLHPAELGRELRLDSSPFLKGRRSIIKLALFSCAALGVVALYQTGILKRLPGPRWPRLDAEKVNGSAEAYSIAATPDALLGLASYAVTACLAGMGGANRSHTHPFMAIAMGCKILADAAFAGKLTVDELTRFHSFSFWSLLVAGATFTALPLAVPEARAAFRHLIEEKRA